MKDVNFFGTETYHLEDLSYDVSPASAGEKTNKNWSWHGNFTMTSAAEANLGCSDSTKGSYDVSFQELSSPFTAVLSPWEGRCGSNEGLHTAPKWGLGGHKDLGVGEESLSAKGHSQIEKSEEEQLSLGEFGPGSGPQQQ